MAFSTYEIENLSIIPLLFQTGYLTIKDYDPARRLYTLSYPNMEVEDAFLTWLLSAFNERERSLNENFLWQMIDTLEAHDLDQFFAILATFLPMYLTARGEILPEPFLFDIQTDWLTHRCRGLYQPGTH